MQKRKYRNYSDEDVIRFAKESKSLAQLLNKLDLKPAGGNYINVKRILQRLNVDCDHWHGQSWNKGQQLKDWTNYTRIAHLKPHLILLRSHKCEICQNTVWQDQPIPLEVNHLDGNRTNNDIDNLQLVCCNCHALTKNWRNRK